MTVFPDSQQGCHGSSPRLGGPSDGDAARLILVGNPNVGKSLLFGALTGRYATVSNYPGTTVEIIRATGQIGGERREIIDTPGTNSLVPNSEDERVTRDILIAEEGDVIQVGDFKNLRRVLMLTLQLAEFDTAFVLCLNMSDEARDLGYSVDLGRLSELLGIPVVATSALRRWNIDKLRRAIPDASCPTQLVHYPLPVEHGAERIVKLLPEGLRARRGIALAVLAGDRTIVEHVRNVVGDETLAEIDRIREEVQANLPEGLSYTINRHRLAAADRLVDEVFGSPTIAGNGFRSTLGLVTMHPVWGVPFLGAVLWFAWWFVGSFGAGTLVDFVENTIFNHWINPWVIRAFDAITAFPHKHVMVDGIVTSAYTGGTSVHGLEIAGKFFHDLMVGPYGVVTMALTYAIAIVLPIVLTFFIFFGIMEDSGYLPRLAVMLNRIFRKMGLNGKAVLPMVLGLGCDTMATLSTRVLETKKEATIVILLLALGVPCSAQLGVIVAMLGPLAPAATLIWLGVILGTIFLVGWLSAQILPGDASDFIMELPPIRRPKLGNVMIKVMARAEWYLKEAVPLFVIGTLILYVFDLLNLLTWCQKALSPLVVGVLGLPTEAANAFLIGFLRRDYGAAGLFMLQKQGLLDPIQTVVSLTVITLFIPCIANFFMIIRERGARVALYVTAFIVTYAFGIGWVMNHALRAAGIHLGG